MRTSLHTKRQKWSDPHPLHWICAVLKSFGQDEGMYLNVKIGRNKLSMVSLWAPWHMSDRVCRLGFPLHKNYPIRSYCHHFHSLCDRCNRPCHPRMRWESPLPSPPMQLEDMRRLEECSASTASLGENQILSENCDNGEKTYFSKYQKYFRQASTDSLHLVKTRIPNKVTSSLPAIYSLFPNKYSYYFNYFWTIESAGPLR